ncbi:MAG TPA: cellulose synthase operon protein YhjQ/BcsQ [Acidimicrobiales bacterium]|nr:cellulose synthase operon protein YhjQ/BcsQ [Acidimicrobiales bacterium]
MFVTCWSVKGGAGTTVVAAALATSLARHHAASGGALLVDLAGDVPAVLGLPDPRDPGLTGWTRASAEVAGDALARLELSVGSHLALLPRGTGAPGPAARHSVLAGLLAADARPVVVDAGVVGHDSPHLPLVAEASRSLLVTRACYLGLRRALDAPVRPSGVVLVAEPGRSLGLDDVEHVVGAPVVAQVPVDPAVARAVDAGILVRRLPRTLHRSLRRAA